MTFIDFKDTQLAQKTVSSLVGALLFLLVSFPKTYELTNQWLPFQVAKKGCPTDNGLALHSLVFFILIFGSMMLPNGNGLPMLLKTKYSIYSTLVFIVLSAPYVYRLVNMVLRPLVVIFKSGCPTYNGIYIHTLVYFLVIFGLMHLPMDQPNYDVQGNLKTSKPMKLRIKYAIFSTLLFLVVSFPMTYRLTNTLVKPLGLQFIDSSGTPTPLGLMAHTVVFLLGLVLLMSLPKDKTVEYIGRSSSAGTLGLSPEDMNMEQFAGRSSSAGTFAMDPKDLGATRVQGESVQLVENMDTAEEDEQLESQVNDLVKQMEKALSNI